MSKTEILFFTAEIGISLLFAILCVVYHQTYCQRRMAGKSLKKQAIDLFMVSPFSMLVLLNLNANLEMYGQFTESQGFVSYCLLPMFTSYAIVFLTYWFHREKNIFKFKKDMKPLNY